MVKSRSVSFFVQFYAQILAIFFAEAVDEPGFVFISLHGLLDLVQNIFIFLVDLIVQIGSDEGRLEEETALDS